MNNNITILVKVIIATLLLGLIVLLPDGLWDMLTPIMDDTPPLPLLGGITMLPGWRKKNALPTYVWDMFKGMGYILQYDADTDKWACTKGDTRIEVWTGMHRMANDCPLLPTIYGGITTSYDDTDISDIESVWMSNKESVVRALLS